jgi:putative ABC transport system permease protein
MLLFEIFRVAFGALLTNKMRSVLTMLGVVIGIAAVITMVALGEGAQRSVEERLASLGANLLTVRPGQSFFGGIGRGQARLTIEDVEALREGGEAFAGVAPELESRRQVEHGQDNANLSIVGTWPSYFELYNFTLAQGRLFNEGDERGRRRVVVLGALVGRNLGDVPTASLLGEKVSLAGVPFTVVGVLAEKGAQGFSNPDEQLYLPLSTAQLRVLGGDSLRAITVRAASKEQMPAAMVAIDRILRREHRLGAGEDADFNVRDQASLLNTVQETTRTFSFLLAGIAAISLLVGGIGIMNIMLVSVTERTREIGLRKSLGAKRRDILVQFLIEALVLCLAGGALGLALGMASSRVLGNLAGWQMVISTEAILVAFGFSAAVGLFFGLYPARRAAGLNPIEALRWE